MACAIFAALRTQSGCIQQRIGTVMASIRVRALSLLVDGNLTATAIAGTLGVDRNSASHATARAHAAGEVHIVDYLRTGKDLAPVYRLGGGDDVERPAPLDPNDRSTAYRARHPDRNRASSRAWRERNLEQVLAKQAEYRARRRANATPESVPIDPVESCSQNPALPAKEIAVSESVLQYFELDVLPGVKHFTCDRYKATLSTEACADRFGKANGNAPDVHVDRYHACRRCPLGAMHSGVGRDLNIGRLSGMTICGRCHRGATRLIGKHLCISCYNRSRELRIGRNGKGNAPVRLARLDARSVTYRAGGGVKTRELAESVDTEELIVAVLRDEERTPQFGWHAPAAMDWLLDEDLYDRAIGNTVEVVDIAAVADSVQEHTVVPIVASPAADMVVPVPAAIDAVQVHPAADVDPLQVIRDAVAQLEHDAQVCAPTTSRRAPKGQWQQQRREVRVGKVTAGLLRAVGALPPPAVVSIPMTTPFYTADLFAD
ncbi:hypothetical protein OKW41_006145 [Paraburkholderia sp. UCT70]|uniref:hypothetical protein n=1 Tax=Paraburkholderia sp. UCT70 TaxID=2991068 RepID=UPI003D1DC492